MRKVAATARRGADAQIARCDGVQYRVVELVKVALGIDQDCCLVRRGAGGPRVVADRVVGEIVKDFEGEEEARRGDVRVPVEDGAVDDLDFVQMTPR